MPLEGGFAALLIWLVSAAVAGAIASWLQENFKGTPLGQLDQRVVAVILAVLAGLVVYVIQFELGMVIFPELDTPAILILTILLVLGTSQTVYGFFLRERKLVTA